MALLTTLAWQKAEVLAIFIYRWLGKGFGDWFRCNLTLGFIDGLAFGLAEDLALGLPCSSMQFSKGYEKWFS